MRKHLHAVSLAIWKAAPHLIDQTDAERMADAAIAAYEATEPTEATGAVYSPAVAQAIWTYLGYEESDWDNAHLLVARHQVEDITALVVKTFTALHTTANHVAHPTPRLIEPVRLVSEAEIEKDQILRLLEHAVSYLDGDLSDPELIQDLVREAMDRCRALPLAARTTARAEPTEADVDAVLDVIEGDLPGFADGLNPSYKRAMIRAALFAARKGGQA